MKKFTLACAVAFVLGAPAYAQTPVPAPVPSTTVPVPPQPAGVWTLVKHVRFPIPSDQAIGAYPNQMVCQNEAYLYTEQHPQFWTTYGCELRVGVYGGPFGIFGPGIDPWHHRHDHHPVFVPPHHFPHGDGPHDVHHH